MTMLHGCHNREPLKHFYFVEAYVSYAGAMRPRLNRIDSSGWKDHGTDRECQHTQHEPGDDRCGDCRWRVSG